MSRDFFRRHAPFSIRQNSLALTGFLCFTTTLPLRATTHYVDLDSPAPAAPYTNWPTAATSIQDAIDASSLGDLVLVSNGLYATGGAVVGFNSNRVALTKPLTVQSVNGPAVTLIVGSHASSALFSPIVRCAYLTNGASLVGFTLTNGSAGTAQGDAGGGVYGEAGLYAANSVLSNCVLSGNTAYLGGGACRVVLNNCALTCNSAGVGGGAYECTLNNCIIASNTASGSLPTLPPAGHGGGTYRCDLISCVVAGNSASAAGGAVTSGSCNNCTIVSNTAPSGGGVDASMVVTFTNCVVFYNSATLAPNYQSGPTFSHCCTTPLPSGPGNITNDPAFLNPAAGDFRLQTNSPCINAGLNSAVTWLTDLDGNPRIAGGTVDIGAYEVPNPPSIISYAWLQQYSLPTDGSADFLDSDGDGMNNWQEWRAGTDPTDPSSALRITSISATGAVLTVCWQGVTGTTYCLERSTNFFSAPAFLPIQTNIPGTAGTLACPDTNAPTARQALYRVRVQ